MIHTMTVSNNSNKEGMVVEHRLRKCGVCGTPFKIPLGSKYNAMKYCCKACSEEAHRRQKRAYEQRLKDYEIFGKKYLGNSNLKEHCNDDFRQEYKSISNELVRLRLRRKQ